MTSPHRIRLPAPWKTQVSLDAREVRGERWFQAPPALATIAATAQVQLEIELPAQCEAEPSHVRIAINDQPLEVQRMAAGRYAAAVPSAGLLPRNRLVVSFEGATDQSLVAASWIGLSIHAEASGVNSGGTGRMQ